MKSLPPRRSLRTFCCLLAVSVAVFCRSEAAPAQGPPSKRPVTHSDYDLWRTIQGQQISNDGQFVAYSSVGSEGQSDLIVRNLASGAEYKVSRGKSAPAVGAGGKGLPILEGLGTPVGRMQFAADSKFLVFTMAGTKGSPAADGKPAFEPTKAGIVIMDLKSGKMQPLPGVRSFTLAEEFGSGLVYHKAPATPAIKDDGKDDEEEDDEPFAPQVKGGQGAKGGKGGVELKGGLPAAPKIPSDLILRNLSDSTELTIPDVVDYVLTRDGRALICSIAPKEPGETGVFAFVGTNDGKLDKITLASGKAKYSRFVWDDKQRRFAFFADRTASSKDPFDLAVHMWDATAPVKKGTPLTEPRALEMFNSKTPGLKDGMVLTERGGLNFSDDGAIIYVGAAPPLPPPPPPADMGAGKDPKEEKVNVELWHWKDDFVQPMQKAKVAQERLRTYSAVFHIKQKKLLQLADKSMPGLALARDGNHAIGSDDQPYRAMLAYDSSYADYYLVNTTDGRRKPLLRKHHWGVAFSPSGRMAIYYDNKDWIVVSLPDGNTTNLTKSIPTKFWNEDDDHPAAPPAYGVAGWSADEYNVLLYDKFDIWEVAAKGGGFRNLTGGVGRQAKIQFRNVRLDPRERTVNLSQPLLLRFESLVNRDSGFARLDPRGKGPEALAKQPFYFGVPQKARQAGTLLLTAESYFEAPELYVTNMNFDKLNLISDFHTQKEKFLWGRSEMVHYKSADGVPLNGMLIKPENYDPKKKYPMIVYIYERLSQNLNHFVFPRAGTSINPTYYASNGYLVFMPDIAYEVGQPGQSALKCVLPGIQAVVDGLNGAVDENAIGIQGHSWGGYQIAYMITQTGRFKAAAAGAPVSNMISAYDGIRWGTGMPRQFQYEKTQSRIGGSLWQFPMRFIENSPVFMADRVKTPLMMLHNDQDDAVPWYQGIEYYLALRRLGKEVYLFNYPGEFHGLRSKANQKDYTIRMQQFFDHHLRGAPAPEWMVRGIPYTPPSGAKTPAASASEN